MHACACVAKAHTGQLYGHIKQKTTWHVCAALRPAVQKNNKDLDLPEKDGHALTLTFSDQYPIIVFI